MDNPALVSLLAYLATQLTKGEGWHKLFNLLWSVLVAVAAAYLKDGGTVDVNSAWQTFAGASAFWGLFKLTGTGNILQANLAEAVATSVTKLGGNLSTAAVNLTRKPNGIVQATGELNVIYRTYGMPPSDPAKAKEAVEAWKTKWPTFAGLLPPGYPGI